MSSHAHTLHWITTLSLALAAWGGLFAPGAGAPGSTALARHALAPSAAPQVVSWSVQPWAIPADGQTQSLLTAQVSDADGDLQEVTVDLSSLGGPASAPLFDDGLHHDGAAGDGLFGLFVTARPDSQPGEVPLVLTASDAQGGRAEQPLGTFLVLPAPRAPWPAGLPPFLGLGAGDGDWQESSELPWNYVSRFLTWNWMDWNAQYAADFARGAWERGAVPMFNIYMLQSAAPCDGLSELDCNFAHAQDAGIMAGYFERLREAARQVKGDKPVIFHLEPDAVAYMHRYSGEHDGQAGVAAGEPDTIPARSGDPAYPDTFAGAVQRMVDVIHQEAPNALVGLHARSWATGIDLAGNVSENLDVEATARSIAHFLSEAGGPDLDLIVVDWKTYDAGSGKSPWWDDQNIDLPHFNRSLYWQSQVSYYTGLPLILWKVPVGNMSLDNTCTHYQDNRLDYVFNHTRDLAEAGIVAVVFGGGDDCRTTVVTDGGNLLAKAAQYYSPPSAPGQIEVIDQGDLGAVRLAWQPVGGFDLWGYRVYAGSSPTSLHPIWDADLHTSPWVTLPAGAWYVSVAAYDARGEESTRTPPVFVEVGDYQRSYLPLVQR